MMILAWECTEVETEGGGGAERWAESFYLTPWDDVKSPTSLPSLHPPPPHFHMQRNLLVALCGGLGSWLSAHTCMWCPPPLPPKWRTTDISVMRFYSKWCKNSKVDDKDGVLRFCDSKQHSGGKKMCRLNSEIWSLTKCALPLSSPKQLAAWRFSELLLGGSCG